MDPVVLEAIQYLQDEVRPRAQDIDQDVSALREALQGLCARDWMALKRPVAYGGPEVSEDSFRAFQEETARTSGSLAFLQTQHQSAVSMLSKSDNEELKQRYLPKMGNGEKLVGIGFSQLRRPGPPAMRATRVEGGYSLTGHVPWITGWSFYGEFLIGAALEDGTAVFGVVPLVDSKQGVGTIRISEPMKLAAMETAMTVTADFDGWFVSDADVAFIRPAGWIQNNDMINIALQGHFALGCAQAGLDVLKIAADKRGLDFLTDAYDRLATELAECRTETARAQALVDGGEVSDAGDAGDAGDQSTSPSSPISPTSITDLRLNVRAWAIDLAVRCAHAAVTGSSGAANSLKHPAQRIYREALVYTVSAQTTPIMEATLRRLLRGR